MKTLFALLLVCMCASWAYAAPPACTAYAAANGSGSTCSESAPCNVGTWLSSKAAPGGVLCLRDGVYRGDSQMLQFSAKSGTASNPITVRAQNDGKVLIDGEHARRPLDCAASYITVIGVDVKNGHDTTAVVRGQYCTIQRVVAWTQAPTDGGTENVWDIGGGHNLVEDFAGYGYSRKILACGARGGSGPNTVRRGWLEHNGSPYGSAQGNPTEVLELGYNQDNCTAENIIARRNILSSATEPEAALHAFSTRGSALLGSISYALASDKYDTDILLNITAESGSHAGSGHVTTNFLLQDVLLMADPVHDRMRGFIIDGGSGSTGNKAKNIVAVAHEPGRCQGDGWECTNIHAGSSLEQALGGKQLASVAPGVCFEVVGRQVTSTPLWPWKMQGRIQAVLSGARFPADIAAQCGAAGPGPGPGPSVPVPPTNVQATVQGTGVLISWSDTVNTQQTGYVVERKVPPGGYDHLANAPGTSTRSYTDASPVVGASNCYVVYSRGTAGPSGFSPEACVQVGGAPGPGTSVPLTCEGSLEAGGKISMQCHPTPQAGRR